MRDDLWRLRDAMLFICLLQAGYSPLHQAATEGHEEVVKLLLKSGCHVDTQDELVSKNHSVISFSEMPPSL